MAAKIATLKITVSSEHEKYRKQIAEAFSDFDAEINFDLHRLSAGDLPMQVILYIGYNIINTTVSAMFLWAIQNLYKKIKDVHISIKGADPAMFVVFPDLSVKPIVPPEKERKYSHIKNFEDLQKHLLKISKKSPLSEWSLLKVSDIFDFVKSYAFSRDNLINNTENIEGVGNIHYGDIHSTFLTPIIDLRQVSVPMIKDSAFNPKPEDLLRDGDLVMADASEDYEGVGATVLLNGLGNKKVIGGLHTFVLRDNKNITNKFFRQYIFRNPNIRNTLQKVANGVSVFGISKTSVSKLILPIPPLPEQNRIVAVLETWDQAIEKLTKKIEIKKQIKKGLMRDLLSGKKRLSGFKDKWQTVELGELLDYEQPTKYLVQTTNYDDVHKTPVLTANKGFILGYTDETNGIYKKHPVIIFDDFTTDNKFVDFDFKVKSSAIKILTPKNDGVDLKFVFERIQLINFIVGQHKRHYLSEYQYITIDTPDTKEQNAIADILFTADKEIKALKNKLSIIKDQKKYLLNNLITSTIRTPENLKIS